MSTVQLVGFHLTQNLCGIYPCYFERCNKCQRGFPFDEPYTVSLSDLAVLERAPDEIKRLPQTEIERLRALLPITKRSKRTGDPISECLCPKPETDSLPIIPLAKIEMRIRVDNICCDRKKYMSIIRGESWSCPFCLDIICSVSCLIRHTKIMHIDDGQWRGRSIVVDRALLGGEWCPLCSHVFRKGELLSDTVNITSDQLLDMIQWEGGRRWMPEKIILERYTIKNKLCQRCSDWDEKKVLRIFYSLREAQSTQTSMMTRKDLYPLDSYIPPNVMRDTLHLSELGSIQTYDNDDENSQFFVDLLRQDMFEEIKDSFLETTSIVRNIWDTVLYIGDGSLRRLRTFEEVKATPIPGAKLLAKIRTEVALLDIALTQTNIIAPLRHIIREYLPWQLWNLERLLSMIHADVIRYAPSLASLLSVIGASHFPFSDSLKFEID
ncbi:MAG: hypothetical protein Harvfovirus38_2 [Harvfovirus sp.]|uniref:C2H2-type domain-containing protein n=1 Tax=Harvfovirus sp. TaxID=2487768 RepID=A0A3G5A2Q4_9VIRU|nr:MAG: hypothetical protein Harvfovirus38_2 [Harvfovirus sp.]